MTGLIPTIFAASGAEPQGIAALGIDPWAILAQAVTFLVLFWIVKKFALDKIVATIEERRKTIDKGVTLGLKMEQEKEQLDEKVEAMLRKARLEADKVISQSEKDAGGIIKEAEITANKKADALMAEAHNRIEDDMQRAKRELKQEMVELVSAATETIIEEKVDATKDAKLIGKALKEVQ